VRDLLCEAGEGYSGGRRNLAFRTRRVRCCTQRGAVQSHGGCMIFAKTFAWCWGMRGLAIRAKSGRRTSCEVKESMEGDSACCRKLRGKAAEPQSDMRARRGFKRLVGELVKAR